MPQLLPLALALLLTQDPLPAPTQGAPTQGTPTQGAPTQDAPTQAPAPQAPPLVPGAVPESASPKARELWAALRAATLGATPRDKVSAFELSFDARGWEAGGRGEADFNDGRIRFLAPGFVDSSLEVKGRRRLRGPDGDWLVDGAGRKVRLQGIDYEQDRRELDQIVHIARTFANLVDPANLRLRSLAVLEATPFPLPKTMLERAKGLAWLDLVSPDFAIARKDGSSSGREVRAWIGLDATTHLPRLAVVAEDDKGTLVHESATLLAFDKYKLVDGFHVPFDVQTFPSDLTLSPWQFAERSKLRLYVKSASLRAAFAPESFKP